MEEDSMDITMSTENCSMLDSSVLDSSVLSTNTVTSSRRRIKKGSAVVLNKNKLKYIEKVEEAIYTITTATLSSADQADDSYGGSHSHSHSNSHSYSHNNSDNQSGLGQGISVRSAANSESSTIYRDNYSADSSSHSSPEVLKQSSLLIHKRQIPQQQLHFQESHNRSVDPHASAEECQAISRIVAWWGKYKLRIKLFRFRQSYKWSIVTSHKVLAAFLGYRVRYIMSSNMVKQLVLSQKDIYHVITDMFGINTSAVYSVKTFKKVKKNSNGSVNSDVVEPMRLETIIHAVRTNNYSKIRFMEPMSATDQTLAFSLVKQYLMEKDQLHEILFSTAAWLPFPGYWDLSITVAEAIQSNKNFKNNRRSSVTSTNKTTNSTSNVTKKNPLGELDTQQVVEAAPLRGSLLRSPVPARQRTAWETPPHCKDDVEVDNNENSGFYQSNGKDDRRMPKPLKEILAAKSTNQSSEVAASQSSTVYDSQSFSHTGPISTARSIRTFSSPPTILPKHQESVAPALPSVRKRSGPRGHVQLDVLSADKLMPAKKVDFTYC